MLPTLEGKLTEEAFPGATVGVSYHALTIKLEKATTHNQIIAAIKYAFTLKPISYSFFNNLAIGLPSHNSFVFQGGI